MGKEVKEEVKTEKKSKKGLVITLIIVGILLLVGIGILLFFLLGSKDITISFDPDGGSIVEKITFKKGKTVLLPSSDKDGYQFVGWYVCDNELKSEDTPKLKDSIIVKAKWELLNPDSKEVTITFDSKGGSKVEPIKLICADDDSITIESFPANPTQKDATFISWVDQHETPILAGAKLTCDDITLYANWEFEGPTANPETPTTTTVVNEKKYKCPDGYELKDTNRCVKLADAENYCESGYTEVNGTCVNKSSRNDGTRTCKKEYVDGAYRTGTYIQTTGSPAYCGYMELPSYTGTRSGCENANGTYSSINNRCYKVLKINNYETTCASGENYFAAQALGGGSNPGCYKVQSLKKKCPDGYTSTSTYGACAKIVDATYE